jgi:HAE1 family hydrophobic/amphiphilic exporter-1
MDTRVLNTGISWSARRRLHSGGSHSPSSRERGFFAVIDRVYTAMLHWSMNHRWVIVLICGLTMYSTVPLLRSGLVPFNFLPEDDESQFQVSIEGPQGTSLEAIRQEGRRAVKLIEEKLGKERQLHAANGG